MSEGGLQGCRPPFSFNHPNFNYGEFAIIKHEPGLIIDSSMSMPIEGLGLKLRLIVPRFSWCIQDCSLTSLHIREYSGLVALKRQLWLIIPLPR